ncbi:SMP-30/gluconolactonase/LRE family protein [Ideonella sp. BN130291]|uniref:SMP-30/gluconolactonase/LRE family protein n=1 Tax=Ideonella sp. BN130291 TaxID=3112940 RepID=UPI002E26A37F|nr:SMP-30/gluconolactonase/LRE family protein [Ideonella sp. BN130291]
MEPLLFDPHPLPVSPALLGESPFWHPQEQVLYWCDIPGFKLHRYDPARNLHDEWAFDTDVGCCAPLLGGGLVLALRSGLWRLDPASGRRNQLLKAPYDTAALRFNDGKADPQGRFWVGTLHDAREFKGALYRLEAHRLEPVLDEVAVSNGLAWSPDARTLYWADTKRHTVYAFDHEVTDGSVSNRRVFASFPQRQPEQDLSAYGGRPDGAAVDVEGCYWVAMFEGARLLRLSPQGEVLREVKLPVQCPTMPCFGGADLKTLFITSGRHHRPTEELARQPWAGCVLQMRVDVPGLPTNFAVL